MKYKGVIFDLDGTLVNSLEDIATSMNLVLENNLFPIHDLQAYKHFIGNGIRTLVRRALPETQREEGLVNMYYDSMMRLYHKNCLNTTKLYEGIPTLLNELVSRGLKLAILSNKADEITKTIVSGLLRDWYFDVITGLHTEAHKKPNPHVALQISEKFEFLPENILYVGDTGIDMQTANNAGMYAIGVLWGFRSKEELISNGARLLIDHPMDLVQVFH